MDSLRPVAIAIGALIIVAIVAWWYAQGPRYSLEDTPYEALTEQSTAFSEAEQLYKEGRFTEARAKYESALVSALDPIQEGQIHVKIAHTWRGDGDFIKAIGLYKAIADNARNIKFVRAYAIQNMAVLYDLNGDAAITDEIFKGEPYVSMLEEGNVPQAYVRLYEYASSFYPLALPELRVASWHAQRLIDARNKRVTLEQPEIDASKILIHEKLKNADADIERIRNDQNEVRMLPEIFKRRAVLLGKMAYIGETTFTEADDAFVQAMNVYTATGRPGADGMVRYYYASYLLGLLKPRHEDLRSVLGPFYAPDSPYASSTAVSFFRSERTNALRQKYVLTGFGRIDLNFQAFLKTLGWTEADFARQR